MAQQSKVLAAKPNSQSSIPETHMVETESADSHKLFSDLHTHTMPCSYVFTYMHIHTDIHMYVYTHTQAHIHTGIHAK